MSTLDYTTGKPLKQILAKEFPYARFEISVKQGTHNVTYYSKAELEPGIRQVLAQMIPPIEKYTITKGRGR